MALRTWLGRAQAIAQVTTLTVGGTASAGQVYTATINGNGVSYTAITGNTNAAIATALVAAILASEAPEFLELEWSASGSVITATGSPGRLFEVSSSATGTGTLVTSNVTSAKGPNHWSAAENWSGGAVPVDSDDVVIDSGPSILYDLDQTSIDLDSLRITSGFTNEIGLPDNVGNQSAGYPEYRQRRLAIGSTTTIIESPSRRIRLSLVGTTLTISATGGSETSPSIDLVGDLGTTNVNSGSVFLAEGAGEVFDVTTLNVSSLGSQVPYVRLGSGVILATLEQTDGIVDMSCAATTVTKTGGTLRRSGSGAVTTLRNRSGMVEDSSSGTITTLHNGAEYRRLGSADVTVTTAILYRGSITYDAHGTVTWTNPVQFYECHPPGGPSNPGPAPAYFLPGQHKKFTVAAI